MFNKQLLSDITQGLPRVERLLEGRQTIRRLLTKRWILLLTNNSYINIPNYKRKFTFTLKNYTKLIHSPNTVIYTKISLANKALQYIQNFVLREVQIIYKGQGVEIADKHIEVILRNLVSRLRIIHTGQTVFLPGELLYPNQLQLLMQVFSETYSTLFNEIEIVPVFVGLTAAGRGSTSFLSACSFQNTRKVLMAATINHSSDWLRGLKPHVMLGSRIPAGTGVIRSSKLRQEHKLHQRSEPNQYTQWILLQLQLKQIEEILLYTRT